MARKNQAEAQETTPLTFAEIARDRLTKRVQEYRAFVTRRAAGESLTYEQTEQLLEIMEVLGLPPFAFERDAAALVSYAKTEKKWTDYVADEPRLRDRDRELAAEIKAATERLNALKTEAHRIGVVMGNKAAGYKMTLNQLRNDHPTMLFDLETAVRLRSEELARRRAPAGVS